MQGGEFPRDEHDGEEDLSSDHSLQARFFDWVCSEAF
jgi:hypothetical protein